jgi:hypothetical protein
LHISRLRSLAQPFLLFYATLGFELIHGMFANQHAEAT